MDGEIATKAKQINTLQRVAIKRVAISGTTRKASPRPALRFRFEIQVWDSSALDMEAPLELYDHLSRKAAAFLWLHAREEDLSRFQNHLMSLIFAASSSSLCSPRA